MRIKELAKDTDGNQIFMEWAPDAPTSLLPFQVLICGIAQVSNSPTRWRGPSGLTCITQKDLTRYKRILQGYPAAQCGDELSLLNTEVITNYEDLKDCLIDWVFGNAPFDRGVDIYLLAFRNLVAAQKGQLIIVITLLAAMYDGFHMTAWNYAFASQKEELLWKTPCITVATVLPSAAISTTLVGWTLESIITGSTAIIMVVNAIVFGSAFILSRSFIVVELFISLRSVPIGVYWTPSWLQAIPHVSYQHLTLQVLINHIIASFSELWVISSNPQSLSY